MNRIFGKEQETQLRQWAKSMQANEFALKILGLNNTADGIERLPFGNDVASFYWNYIIGGEFEVKIKLVPTSEHQLSLVIKCKQLAELDWSFSTIKRGIPLNSNLVEEFSTLWLEFASALKAYLAPAPLPIKKVKQSQKCLYIIIGGEVRTSMIVGHESHEVVGRPDASVWSEWQEIPEQTNAYQRTQTTTVKIEDGDWIVVKSTYMDREIYTRVHNIDGEIRQIPLAERWFGGGEENETYTVSGKTASKAKYQEFVKNKNK